FPASSVSHHRDPLGPHRTLDSVGPGFARSGLRASPLPGAKAMAVRLQEVHPAMVHFPIALLPLAIGADILGRLSGRRSLREMGRRVMPVAAAGAAASAITGLLAQKRVQADGRARDILATHRTLNIAVAGAATALATWRWRRRRPSGAYLALGLSSVG